MKTDRGGAVIGSEKFWFRLVVIVGILVRLTDMYNPADYHTINSWRESDYTQVARAFFREEMNPLYPRVDWRGNTSGDVEMEFPAIPWLAALMYSLAGYHEQILRIISTLCSCLALLAFASFARRILPGPGGVFATATFALNGLLVGLSGSIQPEPLQILICILAMVWIHQWSQSGSAGSFFAACALVGAAILAKSPSTYLGFVLAYYALRKMGWRKTLLSARVCGGAALALLPPLAWYLWAHQHFLNTGLSLGVSNESHFLTWGMIIDPYRWIGGNALAEGRDVFAGFGLLLAALAWSHTWERIESAVIWYASVLVFYVIIADTSGDGWAAYYHSNSVAPACLLMGAGFSALLSGPRFLRAYRWSAWGLRFSPYVLGGVVLAVLSIRAYHFVSLKQAQPALRGMYTCMHSFEGSVPTDSKIVVRGGNKFDRHGHPVAYNASMAFTWMDRKGFNYPAEDFSVDTILGFARVGAGFWVAGPDDQQSAGEMRKAAEQFELVATCGWYKLFRLPGPAAIGSAARGEKRAPLFSLVTRRAKREPEPL